MRDVTPRSRSRSSDFPELLRARVDFEARLDRLVATLITGFLAG